MMPLPDRRKDVTMCALIRLDAIPAVGQTDVFAVTVSCSVTLPDFGGSPPHCVLTRDTKACRSNDRDGQRITWQQKYEHSNNF